VRELDGVANADLSGFAESLNRDLCGYKIFHQGKTSLSETLTFDLFFSQTSGEKGRLYLGEQIIEREFILYEIRHLS